MTLDPTNQDRQHQRLRTQITGYLEYRQGDTGFPLRQEAENASQRWRESLAGNASASVRVKLLHDGIAQSLMQFGYTADTNQYELDEIVHNALRALNVSSADTEALAPTLVDYLREANFNQDNPGPQAFGHGPVRSLR